MILSQVFIIKILNSSNTNLGQRDSAVPGFARSLLYRIIFHLFFGVDTPSLEEERKRRPLTISLLQC